MNGTSGDPSLRPRSDAASADEFFVGYMPTTPRGIRARVLAALVGVFVAGGAMTLIGAALQRDPGRGEWDDSMSTVSGVFSSGPYPHVVLDDGGGSVLLVCEGKHAPGRDTWCGPAPQWIGAESKPLDEHLAGALGGKRVKATGRLIHRLDAPGGLRLLELSSAEGSLQVVGTHGPGDGANLDRGRMVQLQGEVADPKCFLGVMKPGEGTTHRGCAWLCISGGIPPVLIVKDGNVERAVLLTSNSLPANSLVLDFVGDTVAITGYLGRCDGLDVLDFQPSDFHRLP